MSIMLPPQQERLLTAQEAGRLLGLSDARIRQLLLEGRLKGVKISPFLWLLPESEIRRYALERRPPGRPPRK